MLETDKCKGFLSFWVSVNGNVNSDQRASLKIYMTWKLSAIGHWNFEKYKAQKIVYHIFFINTDLITRIVYWGVRVGKVGECFYTCNNNLKKLTLIKSSKSSSSSTWSVIPLTKRVCFCSSDKSGLEPIFLLLLVWDLLFHEIFKKKIFLFCLQNVAFFINWWPE